MARIKKTLLDVKDIIPKLNQIVTAVSKAVETGATDSVLGQIAESSRSLISARFAALGVLDSTGRFLDYHVASESAETNDMIRSSLPDGRGLLGLVMDEKRSLLVDTVITDPEAAGFPSGHPEVKHLLGVPIHIGNQMLGILYLIDRCDGKPFDGNDLLIVEILASYAALTITGVHFSEQRQRISLYEERERIAMELHDGIIQSLYGIGMQLELARADGQIDVAEIKDVVKSLDDVINDIRYTIRDLRKKELGIRPIKETFENILGRLHIPTGIAVRIQASEARSSLTSAQHETVGMILIEAVSNAIRHAGPKEITITAREDIQYFTLMIRDDGRGFDPEDTISSGGGMGLNNIRQRAKMAGGDLKIESNDMGTTLTITLPML